MATMRSSRSACAQAATAPKGKLKTRHQSKSFMRDIGIRRSLSVNRIVSLKNILFPVTVAGDRTLQHVGYAPVNATQPFELKVQNDAVFQVFAVDCFQEIGIECVIKV